MHNYRYKTTSVRSIRTCCACKKKWYTNAMLKRSPVSTINTVSCKLQELARWRRSNSCFKTTVCFRLGSQKILSEVWFTSVEMKLLRCIEKFSISKHGFMFWRGLTMVGLLKTVSGQLPFLSLGISTMLWAGLATIPTNSWLSYVYFCSTFHHCFDISHTSEVFVNPPAHQSKL